MKRLLYIIISSIAFASCEKELSEITFDEEPLIIVNAMLEAEWEEHTILLNTTGQNETKPLPSAEIRIYINGNLVTTITSDSEYYHFKAHFKENDQVDIEVTCEEMHKKATASCTVPEAVIIGKTSTTFVRQKEDNRNWVQTYLRSFIPIKRATSKGTSYYRLTLDDNTYSLYGYSARWDEEEQKYIVTDPYIRHDQSNNYRFSSDIALNNGQTNGNDDENYIDWLSTPPNIYGIFTSSFFDKDQYTLKIDVKDADKPFDDYLRLLNFKIRSITYDEYNYLLGVSSLKEHESGYIMENPPMVMSNINGGTGIFSISSSAEVQIEDKNCDKIEIEQFYDYMYNEVYTETQHPTDHNSYIYEN